MKTINGDTINFVELPFCEHCGEGHEAFGAQIDDGNTQWCLSCYMCSNDITDEEMEVIRTIDIKETIGWHKKQIWKLEKILKEDT